MGYQNPFKSFTKFEWALWLGSILLIIILFIVGEQKDVYTLCASLIGVTSLVFIAKGDVLGQFLAIIFSVFYAVVSYKLRYYGEMLTYIGMSAPIALLSAISWIRHPHEKGKNEVKVANLTTLKIIMVIVLTVIVTYAFYFILKYFDTANLIVSTISIATSFSASFLMALRSPYYALAYAANDVVLITLWIMASVKNIAHLPMALCFLIFLVNDIYAFINWQRMRRRQLREATNNV